MTLALEQEVLLFHGRTGLAKALSEALDDGCTHRCKKYTEREGSPELSCRVTQRLSWV